MIWWYEEHLAKHDAVVNAFSQLQAFIRECCCQTVPGLPLEDGIFQKEPGSPRAECFWGAGSPASSMSIQMGDLENIAEARMKTMQEHHMKNCRNQYPGWELKNTCICQKELQLSVLQ